MKSIFVSNHIANNGDFDMTYENICIRHVKFAQSAFEGRKNLDVEIWAETAEDGKKSKISKTQWQEKFTALSTQKLYS